MGDITNAYYNGGAVKWDGLDVGFVKDVDFIHNLDLEALKTSGTGGPLKLRGKKAKEITCQLKAGLFEVGRPDMMSLMLGGGSPPADMGGAPVVKTNQVLPVAAYQGGSIKAIVLDGRNVSAVTLKKTDDTVAVLNTDYFLDAIKALSQMSYRPMKLDSLFLAGIDLGRRSLTTSVLLTHPASDLVR